MPTPTDDISTLNKYKPTIQHITTKKPLIYRQKSIFEAFLKPHIIFTKYIQFITILLFFITNDASSNPSNKTHQSQKSSNYFKKLNLIIKIPLQKHHFPILFDCK